MCVYIHGARWLYPQFCICVQGCAVNVHNNNENVLSLNMMMHETCTSICTLSAHHVRRNVFRVVFVSLSFFFSCSFISNIQVCIFFQRLVCYQPLHDMPQTQDCNNAFVNWILEVIFVYAIFSRYKKRPDRTLCRLCLFVFVCVYLSLFLCVCLRAWVKCTVSHLNLWDFTEPKKAVIVNI